MKIDSHQHFWSYDASQYPWFPAGSPLQRDWLPEDLARLQRPLGFDGSIAVQARQSLEESRWLLALADADPRIKGVVGWVDLRSEHVDDELAEFATHPCFVGVRHVVQDEPDDGFMLRPEFMRGIGKLLQHGLTYDLLVFPKQLPAAIGLVERFPEQPFVLDHIAKPFIKAGTLSPWREQVRELATFPNVCCKVSGMVTEADWTDWDAPRIAPYADHVLSCFGAERVMFGTDWPVCEVAATYGEVVGLARVLTAGLSDAERDQFFTTTARRVYALPI